MSWTDNVMSQITYYVVTNEEIFKTFVEKCEQLRAERSKEWVSFNPKITVKNGKKYWKMMVENGGPGCYSVWAFVDKITLDVYKPASWAAPAAKARGNAKADPKLFCSWTGPNYLR